MAYIDIYTHITSTVEYYDGHRERGPSTEFHSTASDPNALQSVQKKVEGAMRQTKNLGWLNALINIGRVIQPSAQDAPKIKKDITYHVKMRAIIHYDDGTTEERNYTENITRPAVNSPFGS